MLKRKDLILISAMELLNEDGINGVTTKRLAEKQNISEAALYKQFKNKKDIFMHIIDEYSRYDRKIQNSIKEADFNGTEALVYYFDRYSELYQNYTGLTTVMFSFDLFQYDEDIRSKMQTIFKNRVSFLETIASREDLIDNKLGLSPVELASFLNGIITSTIYEWRMSNMSFPLAERLKKTLKTVIQP